MAWKTPLLIVNRGRLNSPLDSFGTMNPCEITVKRITVMLIKAKVLAFANWTLLALVRLSLQKLSYLRNILVQTQRIADPQNENDNHSPAIDQQTQNRYIL